MGGHDSAYLVDTVGPALSKGVAATVQAQPEDPVEYLANWLLRYVENAELQSAYLKEKRKAAEEQCAYAAQQQEVKKREEAAAAARKAAVEGLAAMVDEPRKLWQAAADLVRTHTAASGAYVANIVDEEEPDWAPPEDAGEPDAETDDEGGPAAAGDSDETAAADPTGEEEQQEQDGGEGEEAAEGAEGSDAAGEAGAAGGWKQPDYSKKLLTYVAACSGQEFVCDVELKRPAPPAEEAEEGAAAAVAPTPITFKILDELVPLLEVPAVAMEPRVTFFRGLPGIGGYVAAAVPAGGANPAAGAYSAILAADTLLPSGSGQPLAAGDVAFIWEVAQALGKALAGAAAQQQRDIAAAGTVGKDGLAALRAQLAEVEKGAPAPETVPEVGEAPAAAEAHEEGGEEEGEAAAGAGLAGLEEAVSGLEAQLSHLDQQLAAGKVIVANAAAALATADKGLACVVKALTSVRGVALRSLRMFTASPPATTHALRAALLLLGRPPASLASWKALHQHLSLSLFEELAAYDAHQERDMALWARVRRAVKGVRSAKDLERELPNCALGSLLLLWVSQVRRAAKRAAALRQAEAALSAATADKAAKQQALAAAVEARDKAAAAEAAAAAAAAEAQVAAAAEAQGEEGSGEAEAEEEV